jgi:hypothetical protein
MNNQKSDKKQSSDRNKKAASILRTVETKDLANVTGGACRGCGLGVSTPVEQV